MSKAFKAGNHFCAKKSIAGIGGSLNAGHYHCYIRKELEDSDIFYKAEDDKEIKTISDEDVKRHLPSAYTFVYLKQQPTVKEDKNIVTVEDTVEDTLSEEEMGKPIVISDDEQGSERLVMKYSKSLVTMQKLLIQIV